MRGYGMRSLMSVAALSLGIAGIVAQPAPIREDEAPPRAPKPKKKPPKSHRPSGLFRSSAPAIGSIAKGNRHGGEHQHSREIQRRLRQAARRGRPNPGG